MSLPCSKSMKSFTAVACLAGALSISLMAQDSASAAPQTPQPSQPAPAQAFVMKDYSKPRSHFPNPIAPYQSRTLAPINLSNTARIDQLLQEGKLMISIDE